MRSPLGLQGGDPVLSLGGGFRVAPCFYQGCSAVLFGPVGVGLELGRLPGQGLDRPVLRLAVGLDLVDRLEGGRILLLGRRDKPVELPAAPSPRPGGVEQPEHESATQDLSDPGPASQREEQALDHAG